MQTKTQRPADPDDAASVTQGLLMEMEKFSSGDAERALIASNSMIAAAKMLLRRYAVDEQQRRALFQEYWKPLLLEDAA